MTTLHPPTHYKGLATSLTTSVALALAWLEVNMRGVFTLQTACPLVLPWAKCLLTFTQLRARFHLGLSKQ